MNLTIMTVESTMGLLSFPAAEWISNDMKKNLYPMVTLIMHFFGIMLPIYLSIYIYIFGHICLIWFQLLESLFYLLRLF